MIRLKTLGLAMQRPGLVLFTAAFTSGLLLGWLIIGWWLWPVEWTSFNPEQASGDYQHMFVTWAANRYWQTGDATQVQNAFANWNRADLATLLLNMQRQTTDVETRRRLIALIVALNLPVSDSSLLSFISQPGIVLGVFLATVPLLAGFALVTIPRIRKRVAATEEFLSEATPPEESLDEMLINAETGEPAAAPGEEKKEEEKKEEPPAEEQSDDASAGLGDLASLFEEEDTSINVLEAFCKGMPEISVDELLTMSADIVHRLRTGTVAV